MTVEASDTTVAVAVRDLGVGLGPGEAARVFDRFWRADPARARTTGGTGLGLSIALEDAHLHGGDLIAWGEPGRGSQFCLLLPCTVKGPIEPMSLCHPPGGGGDTAPVQPQEAKTSSKGTA